ncbi:hypothetical protein IW261DRAFT_1598684 [Armillaria novae-zelandiae]|uniref:Uncharacterized protein n=1 Tax=Armillaria novae-zelandiae TaxID=153914 RepID=A0AA39NFR7_9AGAR|nr:hypothetical protein IW261DRAFT_1598684 [Armillaria novae-zelandiae]
MQSDEMGTQTKRQAQVLSAWEPENEPEAESGTPNTVGSRWVGRKNSEDGRVLARESLRGDVKEGSNFPRKAALLSPSTSLALSGQNTAVFSVLSSHLPTPYSAWFTRFGFWPVFWFPGAQDLGLPLRLGSHFVGLHLHSTRRVRTRNGGDINSNNLTSLPVRRRTTSFRDVFVFHFCDYIFTVARARAFFALDGLLMAYYDTLPAIARGVVPTPLVRRVAAGFITFFAKSRLTRYVLGSQSGLSMTGAFFEHDDQRGGEECVYREPMEGHEDTTVGSVICKGDLETPLKEPSDDIW